MDAGGGGGGVQQVLARPTPGGRITVAAHDTPNSIVDISSVVVDVAAAADDSLTSGLSSNDFGDDLMRPTSSAPAYSGRSLVTVDSITAPPGKPRPALSPNCFSSFLYLLRRF